MSAPAGTQQGTRPGGRSAQKRAAVHRAVAELLAEQADLTLPVVAARAGVHPTTLYRRWGSVGDLLADVATSRFTGEVVVPDTGSLRADLERWAADVATDVSDPDVLMLMRAAVGAGESGACACRGDREEQLAALLDRERARGGRPPTVARAAEVLLGAIYYRAIFTETPGTPEWARGLVEVLLPS
ncbi:MULTISPECIES: TetR-like C-terminal domain-containing protein [Pseudonocardia]|uniref:Transcriptional regulator, TetR family n=1 Tax=Pseudonocardia oroxyli TaxID=366584 RepID=A0A1G7DTT4_PSEOR|nr:MULTISPECIES: TetR-like C-terminal domain-containing protein [Pseudonocardia]MCF7548774.1 TetR/AcrR family transcriptional regulator C-terminal ligand-binding domain-containing protein [Pseudonocardia sp. WMMC193]SDE54546.1 transcriptional regulator, TetR family [Pseudonocardia oroxyli]